MGLDILAVSLIIFFSVGIIVLIAIENAFLAGPKSALGNEPLSLSGIFASGNNHHPDQC